MVRSSFWEIPTKYNKTQSQGLHTDNTLPSASSCSFITKKGLLAEVPQVTSAVQETWKEAVSCLDEYQTT